VFEPYLAFYINRFAGKSLDTDEWKASLFEWFGDSKNPGGGEKTIAKLEKEVDWEAWVFGLGMPPVANKFDDTLAKQADALAAKWIYAIASAPTDPNEAGKYYAGLFSKDDLEGFSSAQTMRLLDQIGEKAPIAHAAVVAMDGVYGLTDVRNSEIRFRWEQLCLRWVRGDGRGVARRRLTELFSLYKVLVQTDIADYQGLFDDPGTDEVYPAA
jgi:leukotriene-A4 hydrolase